MLVKRIFLHKVSINLRHVYDEIYRDDNVYDEIYRDGNGGTGFSICRAADKAGAGWVSRLGFDIDYSLMEWFFKYKAGETPLLSFL